MKIALLYGSVRPHRQGIRVVRHLERHLRLGPHELTVVDARHRPLPLLEKMYKEYEEGQAPEILETLHGILEEADAYVVCTGEYNHGLPPGLKNLLDHFQTEYFDKPAGIASYSAGAYGGMRAAVHLRAVLSELGMVTLPTIFGVPKVQDSLGEQGEDPEDRFAKLREKFLGELEWYGEALKAARPRPS